LPHGGCTMVIASRRSRLARVQTQYVAAALHRFHRDVDVQYQWIESEGDQQTNGPLASTEGKGPFTRAIEDAVRRGDAHLAVHSLKDLPAADGQPTHVSALTLVAVPARADVRDCLIGQAGPTSVDRLPRHAAVGTASPRRAAQLLRLRPDLRILLIRGNVETRLRKVVDQQKYDATVLAAAGLRRLGLDNYVQEPLPLETMLPAAGQGALAVQCRADDTDTVERLLPLNNARCAAAVGAERQVVAALGGDCHAAIAVLCESDDARIRIRARVLSTDGRRCIEANEAAAANQTSELATRVIGRLREAGAEQVLHGP